jgi:hypothetical protein
VQWLASPEIPREALDVAMPWYIHTLGRGYFPNFETANSMDRRFCGVTALNGGAGQRRIPKPRRSAGLPGVFIRYNGSIEVHSSLLRCIPKPGEIEVALEAGLSFCITVSRCPFEIVHFPPAIPVAALFRGVSNGLSGVFHVQCAKSHDPTSSLQMSARYGFIQPQGGGGKDVFVHISAVERAAVPLQSHEAHLICGDLSHGWWWA